MHALAHVTGGGIPTTSPDPPGRCDVVLRRGRDAHLRGDPAGRRRVRRRDGARLQPGLGDAGVCLGHDRFDAVDAVRGGKEAWIVGEVSEGTVGSICITRNLHHSSRALGPMCTASALCLWSRSPLFPPVRFRDEHVPPCPRTAAPEQIGTVARCFRAGRTCRSQVRGILWAHNDSGDMPRIYAPTAPARRAQP